MTSYMDEPYSCGRNVSSSKDSGANMNHRAQPNQRWPCGKKCDFSHNCIFNAGSRSKLDSRTPCCTSPYLDSIKFPMKHSCSLIIIGLVTGADPARVQRVHLHPLRFGNGCNAPVQKRTKSLKIYQFTVARFKSYNTVILKVWQTII